MAGILAAAAYAAIAVYVVIIRPVRKARPRPEYKIKGDKIYRA